MTWMRQFLYFTTKDNLLGLFSWIWVKTRFPLKNLLINLFQVRLSFNSLPEAFTS